MSRKAHNTNKLKTFLVFLFVACIIWVLTKFSKDYTATVPASLHYTNLPENSVLGDNNLSEVNFDLTANGFEFLKHQLKTPLIEIDVATFYSEEIKTAIIPKNELIRIISAQLNNEKAVANLSIDELNVSLDLLVTKMVPVVVDSRISFKEGFRATNGYQLKPDSVSVSGAKLLLDTLKQISTEPITLDGLDISKELDVALVLEGTEDVILRPERVSLNISVEEFTQKTVSVEITLLNVPSDTTLKIIPERVDISFDVSVARFNSITAEDFTIVCDFNERNSEENFMTAKLSSKPTDIFNVELNERKIDYLIFK